ncbi:MAG: hypothetical protein KDC48_14875, partial [Planctomycetes bacterium]|nr:hypothetical protein [Planctomycetota bacterium]
MTATTCPTDPTAVPPTDTALDLLEPFVARVLPGTVRRIATWRSLSSAVATDLLDDLRQELALDCLQHGRAIRDLPQPERHRRWMRLVECWIRRQTRASRRGACPQPDPELLISREAAPTDELPELPELPAAFSRRMRNGRCNLSACARDGGATQHALRREVDALVARLGRGARYVGFWRNRLAEVLTGLAADLLRQRGALQVVRGATSAPDPQRRLLRLRRLRRRVPVWRNAIDLRRVMRRWSSLPDVLAASPRQLLEQATELNPFLGTAWLWLFEACVAENDLLAA